MFWKKKPNKAQARLKDATSYFRWQIKQKSRCNNEQEISQAYFLKFNRYPDLENPKRYSEKMQWMKLHYNDPLYAKCTDKYAVRAYVESKGLGHILNELFGVYKSPEQIDINKLPDKFVLKATHGCGWNLICKDKAEEVAIWEDNKALLSQWLTQDYSLANRELHYTYVPPRLICERFLEGLAEAMELKIFCFHGKPEFILVDYDLETGYLRRSYDADWNPAAFSVGMVEEYPTPIEKPGNLDEILDIAKKLSEDFTHVRVDLYVFRGQIYFGELTFTSGAGYSVIRPDEMDEGIGNLWQLPIDSPFVVK